MSGRDANQLAKEEMMAVPERPEGRVPRSDQKCPLCHAEPGVEHKEDCPWRVWAEAKRDA